MQKDHSEKSSRITDDEKKSDFGPKTDLDTQQELKNPFETDAQAVATAINIEIAIQEEIEIIIARRIQFEKALEEIALLQAQHQALQAELKKIQIDIDDNQQLMRDLNEQELERLQALMDERDNLLDEIKGLENDIQELQDTLEELKSEHQEVTENIQEVRDELIQLNAEIEEEENQSFHEAVEERRQELLEECKSNDPVVAEDAMLELQLLEKVTPEKINDICNNTPGMASLQILKCNTALGVEQDMPSEQEIKELGTTRLDRFGSKLNNEMTQEAEGMEVSMERLQRILQKSNGSIMSRLKQHSNEVKKSQRSELIERCDELIDHKNGIELKVEQVQSLLDNKTNALSSKQSELLQNQEKIGKYQQKVMSSRSQSTQKEMRDKLRQVQSPDTEQDIEQEQQQSNGMKFH